MSRTTGAMLAIPFLVLAIVRAAFLGAPLSNQESAGPAVPAGPIRHLPLAAALR
jgi:ABC-type dipeptide/oligopeptide/nickel transport system permease subunit